MATVVAVGINTTASDKEASNRMLSNVLNTNEVKNAAGVEVEFNRLSSNERSTEYAQITESPSSPHRLKVSHQEIGVGLKRRRRSMVRVDKTTISTVDNETPVTSSCYIVLDAPVGALTANTEMANVIAEVMSFCASNGADNIIKYDCTGNGAATLLNGGL